jgi:hypothetical protein
MTGHQSTTEKAGVRGRIAWIFLLAAGCVEVAFALSIEPAKGRTRVSQTELSLLFGAVVSRRPLCWVGDVRRPTRPRTDRAAARRDDEVRRTPSTPACRGSGTDRARTPPTRRILTASGRNRRKNLHPPNLTFGGCVFARVRHNIGGDLLDRKELP